VHDVAPALANVPAGHSSGRGSATTRGPHKRTLAAGLRRSAVCRALQRRTGAGERAAAPHGDVAGGTGARARARAADGAFRAGRALAAAGLAERVGRACCVQKDDAQADQRMSASRAPPRRCQQGRKRRTFTAAARLARRAGHARCAVYRHVEVWKRQLLSILCGAGASAPTRTSRQGVLMHLLTPVKPCVLEPAGHGWQSLRLPVE